MIGALRSAVRALCRASRERVVPPDRLQLDVAVSTDAITLGLSDDGKVPSAAEIAQRLAFPGPLGGLRAHAASLGGLVRARRVAPHGLRLELVLPTEVFARDECEDLGERARCVSGPAPDGGAGQPADSAAVTHPATNTDSP